jgi:hypothetical protein
VTVLANLPKPRVALLLMTIAATVGTLIADEI